MSICIVFWDEIKSCGMGQNRSILVEGEGISNKLMNCACAYNSILKTQGLL